MIYRGAWFTSSDPNLDWPIVEHHDILMADRIDREAVLDIINKLHKQNEYAKRLSADNNKTQTGCRKIGK